MLAVCAFLVAGPRVLAGIIYDVVDPSTKYLCCNSATDRQAINLDAAPTVYTEWSSPAQPAPVWTIDDPEVRSHGPSWTFFLIAILSFITVKTTLAFRPAHRAGVAYARLYWDVFSPLEF